MLGIAAMIREPPSSRAGAAVFLDKDGTLVQDVPYNVDPERIRLAPGALRGVCALAAAGFALVIVSNQPGVALGLHPEQALEGVWRWLRLTFAAHGVALAGIYWCPHHPRGMLAPYATTCDCRKPRPGLVLRAARELDLAPARSWLVGDVLDDVETGRRAGCRTILIDNGNETRWRRGPLRAAHHTVRDLGEAADFIVGHLAPVRPHDGAGLARA